MSTFKEILLMTIFLALTLDGESNLELKFNDNRLAIDSPNSIVTSFVTATFVFIDKDGFPSGANEIILIAFLDRVYPKIIDVIYGHSAKLDVIDLGNDGNLEIALFYTSGARYYNLKLYSLDMDGCRVFNGEKIYSNMHSIQLFNDTIVVQNQEFISENEVEIEKKKFIIRNRKIDLLMLEKEKIKR